MQWCAWVRFYNGHLARRFSVRRQVRDGRCFLHRALIRSNWHASRRTFRSQLIRLLLMILDSSVFKCSQECGRQADSFVSELLCLNPVLSSSTWRVNALQSFRVLCGVHLLYASQTMWCHPSRSVRPLIMGPLCLSAFDLPRRQPHPASRPPKKHIRLKNC